MLRSISRLGSAFLLIVAASVCVHAQPQPVTSPAGNASEMRAIRAFNTAKATSPLALHAFLTGMPKGADLHMHLSGAIYAETFIDNAIADHLCVNTTTLAFVKNIGTTRSIPAQSVCEKK